METIILSSLANILVMPRKLMGNALKVAGSVMERRARVVADILAYAAKTWTALTANVAKIWASFWAAETGPAEAEEVCDANPNDEAPLVSEDQPGVDDVMDKEIVRDEADGHVDAAACSLEGGYEGQGFSGGWEETKSAETMAKLKIGQESSSIE